MIEQGLLYINYNEDGDSDHGVDRSRRIGSWKACAFKQVIWIKFYKLIETLKKKVKVNCLFGISPIFGRQKGQKQRGGGRGLLIFFFYKINQILK